MKKSSIIIPCYWANLDLWDTTSKCLESLFTTSNINEVFVVDDGSPLLPFEVNDLDYGTLIKRPDNGGYASAVNTGLSKSTGDYLIVANNDLIFVQPDWLDHLVKPLEQGYDISSIRTTDSDGWETEDKITEGDKFGSLWVMKREVYEKIGGLDESFGKGYFEDLDYHKRAEDAGFKVAKNHAGLVEHKGKATFRVADPEDKSYTIAEKRFREKWGKVW